MNDVERTERLGVAAFAAIAAIGAAGALVVVRDSVDQAVTALLLALVVAVAGSLAGRSAGVLAAVGAALGFNAFHTRPYGSLRIDDADDVLTTVVLLLVGIVVGLGADRARRRRREANRGHDVLAAVARVAAVAAGGGVPDDVEVAVRAELLTVLGLQGCHYVAGRSTELPVIERSGRIDERVRTYHDGGFELPVGGVALSVLERGRVVGHLVATPVPGVAVTLDARRAAVAIADQLGLARAVHHPVPLGGSGDN